MCKQKDEEREERRRREERESHFPVRGESELYPSVKDQPRETANVDRPHGHCLSQPLHEHNFITFFSTIPKESCHYLGGEVTCSMSHSQ